MKRNQMIRSLTVAGWLSIACIGAAFAQSPLIVPPVSSAGRIQSQSTLPQLPITNDRGQDIIRQAPTLSGRLQVSEQTLIPYIGAGFGGGYVTERDRALGPMPGVPQQNLLGDSFGLGKGMMPNEFQMGIRIPF
ncbi:MAG TPA: hypothetical protein PKN47_00855 [Nitrospira sp.]|nr:hypothetical protein [Nitrospira sp.]